MWVINHLEWCVADLEGTERLLESQFGYKAIAERHGPSCRQRFLALGHSRILLTQKSPGQNGVTQHETSNDGSYPPMFCCEGAHRRDSVFNVAISVSDFDEVLERLLPSGRIITKRTSIKDDGSLRYVIIQAPCDNVVHIILDQKCQDVLPGFKPLFEGKHPGIYLKLDKQIDPYIDHVTYVVPRGFSQKVLCWYSTYLGMKRFLVQSGELPEVGVEIKDNVGLRLMVGEWLTSWSCREEGVRSPGSSSSSVMLVLAEPLEENSDSHVQKFLDNNGGSGIQHVGLAVKEDISNVVQEMIRNGCAFQRPPPTYYQLPTKVHEIQRSGEDLDTFSRLGLLIDSEADYEESSTSALENRDEEKYLIQIFTKPLFKEDTFFMEVLERRGARGFGSGNILALAESIILYNMEAETQRGG